MLPGMLNQKYLNSKLNIQCMEGTLKIGKAVCKTSVKFIGLGTCLNMILRTNL